MLLNQGGGGLDDLPKIAGRNFWEPRIFDVNNPRHHRIVLYFGKRNETWIIEQEMENQPNSDRKHQSGKDHSQTKFHVHLEISPTDSNHMFGLLA